MMNWAMICTLFLATFKVVCQKVNIKIGDPNLVYLRDDATESYVGELRKLVKNSLNMVVIILPLLRQDKYTAVKK